jgi:hypothetical protein
MKIRSVLGHPVEVATALLFLCVLFHVGDASGSAVILAIVGVVAGGVLMAEVQIWLSGEHDAVMAARRVEMTSGERGSLRNVTAFSVVTAVVAEVLWCTSVLIPHPKNGALVSTPSAWILAHVVAVPAVLVAYRHSSDKYRLFLTVATFSFVISSLAIASNVSFMSANSGNPASTALTSLTVPPFNTWNP